MCCLTDVVSDAVVKRSRLKRHIEMDIHSGSDVAIGRSDFEVRLELTSIPFEPFRRSTEYRQSGKKDESIVKDDLRDVAELMAQPLPLKRKLHKIARVDKTGK